MKEFSDTKYTGDPAYNWQGSEGCEGQMETFSPHIERVLELVHDDKQRRKVWTVVDADDDCMYIVAGYHLVNRVMYFISNELWAHNGEEYLWYKPERECGHEDYEDCMICAECGECKEDLDSSDVCMDCGGVDENEEPVAKCLIRHRPECNITMQFQGTSANGPSCTCGAENIMTFIDIIAARLGEAEAIMKQMAGRMNKDVVPSTYHKYMRRKNNEQARRAEGS